MGAAATRSHGSAVFLARSEQAPGKTGILAQAEQPGFVVGALFMGKHDLPFLFLSNRRVSSAICGEIWG